MISRQEYSNIQIFQLKSSPKRFGNKMDKMDCQNFTKLANPFMSPSTENGLAIMFRSFEQMYILENI